MEWNDERIADLTRLWQDGLSASQVAERLGGISRSAVIGKIHRLGIAGRAAPSRPRPLGGRPPSLKISTGEDRRAPVARPPRPAPRPVVVFDADATASLLTLTECGCRWPIGDPGEADFGFCGRPQAGGGSYCEGHGSMAVRSRETAMKRPQVEYLARSLERPRWYSETAARERDRDDSAAARLALAR
jgi:GcrA cell cycle regulator